MRDARNQDANPTGEGPTRSGQPATSTPAMVGWNSKHPHDIKFPFGPLTEGTGDETERGEARQRPTHRKARETGGEPATAGKRDKKVVRVTVGDLSEDIDVAFAPLRPW